MIKAGIVGGTGYTGVELLRLPACNVVFFAAPNGTAMGMARELVDAGVKVIDLAADFRV